LSHRGRLEVIGGSVGGKMMVVCFVLMVVGWGWRFLVVWGTSHVGIGWGGDSGDVEEVLARVELR